MIWLFKEVFNGSSLDLAGGSATEGLGVIEYYNQVMEPGTYFFAVAGYEGTGNFAFAYYQSSIDVNNEVNDSLLSATNVSLNADIAGIIDSPYDIDCYKFTVSVPMIMKYSISTTDNYSITFAARDGSSAAAYQIQGMSNTYKIMPGTYYFKVQSEAGNYSSDSSYSVKFKNVGNLSTDSKVTRTGVCESANIVYQTNDTGTVYYVNGNHIDIGYSYYKNLSNTAGLQIYDISIDISKVDFVGYRDSTGAEVLYYMSSTRPALSVNSRPVLQLTLIGEACYKINCFGSGAYAMNTYNQDIDAVNVLIDPETGKLVDILEFNYFYNFAPVGSDQILYYRGDYKLTYFK